MGICPQMYQGSSPRVRGTHRGRERRLWTAGIIPACAGNTSPAGAPSCPSRDHPRVCGEHRYWSALLSGVPGSSPRVRGTPSRPAVLWCSPGIIPACAGNTTCRRLAAHADGDHPRVCGEHSIVIGAFKALKGSSPRVRGTRGGPAREGAWLGIIPACAGNTRHWRSRNVQKWDHPRVCGEHVRADLMDCLDRGSSPRVRGTLRSRLGR